MATTNEEFMVRIVGKRRLVLRRPSALADWMFLGDAPDASGAEAIIASWKSAAWTAGC